MGKNPAVPLPTVKKPGWVEANIQSLLCLSGYACSPELLPEQMSTDLPCRAVPGNTLGKQRKVPQ